MGSGLRRIKPRSAKMCLVISALVFVGFVAAGYYCYAESPARKSVQIEYITPDGQFSPVSAARLAPHAPAAAFVDNRSEERRVGKECRSRWGRYRQKQKHEQ